MECVMQPHPLECLNGQRVTFVSPILCEVSGVLTRASESFVIQSEDTTAPYVLSPDNHYEIDGSRIRVVA